MSRIFRCSQFICVTAVLLLAASFAWADTVVGETSQTGLGPDSSISWTQLGGDQTLVPASFSVVSNNTLSTTVTLAGANSVVSAVCSAAPPLSTNCSWNGTGFTAADSLLWAVNAWTGGNGPVTLSFGSGIIGAGALIQSDVPGQFTASIQAFNGSTSLGTFTEKSNASGDALYLGVKDETGANITSVVYSLTACEASCADFALDAVDLATSSGAANFSLSPNPNSVTVAQGNSGTSSITITPSNGFSESVTLSASGLPSGVTASFNPNPATTTSTLTLMASSTATPGTVTVTVKGVSGKLTNTTTLSLTVTTSGGTTVTLTPTSLAFGNVIVDATSAGKNVTLKNTGTSTLNLSSIAVSGDFSPETSTKPCGTTLAAGKTCVIKVSFTPKQLGALSGDITITDNASNSPQTVTLSGTGTAPATLTPASATYAAQKVGTTSAAKVFTLANKQSVALTGVAISTTGDFSVSTTTCTTSLAAKGSCKISIVFKPAATGALTGSLQMSDSAFGSPQTSSLKGTGK